MSDHLDALERALDDAVGRAPVELLPAASVRARGDRRRRHHHALAATSGLSAAAAVVAVVLLVPGLLADSTPRHAPLATHATTTVAGPAATTARAHAPLPPPPAGPATEVGYLRGVTRHGDTLTVAIDRVTVDGGRISDTNPKTRSYTLDATTAVGLTLPLVSNDATPERPLRYSAAELADLWQQRPDAFSGLVFQAWAAPGTTALTELRQVYQP